MNKDASEKMESTVCTAQCFSVVFLIYLSIAFNELSEKAGTGKKI
jgi:hypothetical protein